MIAKRPEQIAADADETEAVQRYVSQRQLAGLLGEAIARADAMWRLETALEHAVPQR
jgi:hypothetical protein